jgi:hypothetical protein
MHQPSMIDFLFDWFTGYLKAHDYLPTYLPTCRVQAANTGYQVRYVYYLDLIL